MLRTGSCMFDITKIDIAFLKRDDYYIWVQIIRKLAIDIVTVLGIHP